MLLLWQRKSQGVIMVKKKAASSKKKLPDNVIQLFSSGHSGENKQEITTFAHIQLFHEVFHFAMLDGYYIVGRYCPLCDMVHILDKGNDFIDLKISVSIYSPFEYVGAVMPLLEYVFKVENPAEN